MSEGCICRRCVMDQSAGFIEFDESGYCNYCRGFCSRSVAGAGGTKERTAELQQVIRRIKADGQGNPYDCVVGVSGGVDSAYVLMKSVELGLRPLAVHMDNGWNSELAQNNISNLVKGLGVDLETHVIRWPEYRSLMQAFFDADVIDVELLYDNAAMAVVRRMARKHGSRYILNGTNIATEGMEMPRAWNWYKSDARNIKAIARSGGVREYNSYPFASTLDLLRDRFVDRRKTVLLLDFLGYRKDEALKVLGTRFGFKPYPYKHYESVFTRFYQGYLLPEKFGVDKRRLHLSNLILTGQIGRDAALELLRQDPYVDPAELRRDRRFFLKKMQWTENDLVQYLTRPERSHGEFANERRMLDAAVQLKRSLWRSRM